MSSSFGKIPGLGQLLRPKAQPFTESPPTQRKTLLTPRETLPLPEVESTSQTDSLVVSPSPVPISVENKAVSDLTSKESVDGPFQPPSNVESQAFLLPEDQISVEMLQRLPENEIQDFGYKPSPLYISSCYDAYSRNYTTIAIGKDLPSLKYNQPFTTR